MIEFDCGSSTSMAGMPPRSELYNVPIAGRGTGDQEALLDYAHRLALAHQIRVRDLLTKIILPKIDISSKWEKGCFQRGFPRTTNGYTKYSFEMENSLSRLTGALGLRDGTFIHWQPMLDHSGSGLLHSKRHWCPECIADDISCGRAPIFKLLWTSLAVTYCEHHLVPLAIHCRACGSDQRFLSETASLGRCEACGATLGWHVKLTKSKAMTKGCRENFMVQAISEMIALGANAAPLASSEILSKRLFAIVATAADGRVSRLTKALGLVNHLAFSKWIHQTAKPRMTALLEVCYRLGVSPVQLLHGAPSAQAFASGQPPLLKRRAQKLTATQLSLIEMEIKEVLEAGSFLYENADAFAAKHNTSAKYLRRRIPEAHGRFMEHLRQARAQRAKARVESREARARQVALALHSSRKKYTEPEINCALSAKKLSLRCPRTRRAFKEEQRRLRARKVGPLVDGQT